MLATPCEHGSLLPNISQSQSPQKRPVVTSNQPLPKRAQKADDPVRLFPLGSPGKAPTTHTAPRRPAPPACTVGETNMLPSPKAEKRSLPKEEHGAAWAKLLGPTGRRRRSTHKSSRGGGGQRPPTSRNILKATQHVGS